MRLQPMLVSTGALPPDSERWSYEVKWDGFRALIQATPNCVTITSRNGHDMTCRYPELQSLTSALKQPVVLDGEIVCLDDNGNPDFAALWFRSRGSATPPVCFMAFDVLEVAGKELMDEPYRERRRILEELNLSGPHLVHTGNPHRGKARPSSTPPNRWVSRAWSRSVSTLVTGRACDRSRGPRRSTFRRATSRCSVGCHRKSGDGTAAASS